MNTFPKYNRSKFELSLELSPNVTLKKPTEYFYK